MSIFKITGSPSQVATIQRAIARCSFPFDKLAFMLQQATGKNQIDVSFQRLGSGVGGMASEAGWIQISTALGDAEAQEVFLMESAHAVDFFYTTNQQRKAIYDAFHPAGPDNHSWFEPSTYWNQVGEAFMYAFVWAFSDLRPASSFAHKPTEAIAATVRQVYGGVTPPNPKPPVPPQPPQPEPTWLQKLINKLFGWINRR